MVEMEVGQEEVDLPRAASDEVETERPDSGAGVQHECASPPSITSTQEVLPPYLTVSDPGVGTEPRHPQIFSCTDIR